MKFHGVEQSAQSLTSSHRADLQIQSQTNWKSTFPSFSTLSAINSKSLKSCNCKLKVVDAESEGNEGTNTDETLRSYTRTTNEVRAIFEYFTHNCTKSDSGSWKRRIASDASTERYCAAVSLASSVANETISGPCHRQVCHRPSGRQSARFERNSPAQSVARCSFNNTY